MIQSTSSTSNAPPVPAFPSLPAGGVRASPETHAGYSAPACFCVTNPCRWPRHTTPHHTPTYFPSLRPDPSPFYRQGTALVKLYSSSRSRRSASPGKGISGDGYLTTAEARFRKVVELLQGHGDDVDVNQPFHHLPAAHHNLAVVLLESGNILEAERWASAATRVNGNHIRVARVLMETILDAKAAAALSATGNAAASDWRADTLWCGDDDGALQRHTNGALSDCKAEAATGGCGAAAPGAPRSECPCHRVMSALSACSILQPIRA